MADKKQSKKKVDKQKMFVRIMALILAVLMGLSVCFTLLYQLFAK